MKVKNDTSQLEYIGTLSKAKGFRGEFVLKDLQKGVETISKGAECFVGFSQQFSTRKELNAFVPKKKSAIISFKDITNENECLPYIEQAVFTERENINKDATSKSQLTEDIVGTIVTEKDQPNTLGTVVEIIYSPSHDIWVIEPFDSTSDILLPAVNEFIISHDSTNKQAIIQIPEGLREI